MTDPQYSTTTPPPPPYGSFPQPPPRRQLRRSRSNRRIAGVAGGLADYLGVEATAIRVGFVLLSVVFLAGFGGVVLYAFAWALIPDEYQGNRWSGGWGPGPWRPYGPQQYGSSPPYGPRGPAQQFGPPPASQPDTVARSWALVLGAITLALIWSFGLSRWWHSGAPAVWVVCACVALWFFGRCRHMGRPAARAGRYGPPNQAQYADQGANRSRGGDPGGGGAGAGGANSGGANSGGADSGGAGGGGDDSGRGPADAPTTPDTAGGHGAAGHESSTSPASGGGPSQEADDWATAQAAAASWAQEQLDAAGVPPSPSGAQTQAPNPQAVAWQQPAWDRRRRGPRLGSMVATVVALFVFLVVAGVIGITFASGGSLVGGVGSVNAAPSAVSAVRSHYNLGLGQLQVDLAGVKFPTSGRTVHVNVGMGKLVLVLPEHTVVDLDASVGVGNVEFPGGSTTEGTQGQLSSPAGLQGNRRPHLRVDAHVGAGVIDVRWGN